MENKGILTVVSGFSGTGKGTVVKLLAAANDNYKISVSYTTRSRREGEIEGVDYYFKSDDEFEMMIEQNGFIEHAGFVGKHYGTPREDVERWLEAGFDVILEIEVDGAMQVKKSMPDSVFIFILPPSVRELKNRLEKRGSESGEEITRRVKRAGKECGFVDKYDFVVVNHIAGECARAVDEIIKSVKAGKDPVRYRVSSAENRELINRIAGELKQEDT